MYISSSFEYKILHLVIFEILSHPLLKFRFLISYSFKSRLKKKKKNHNFKNQMNFLQKWIIICFLIILSPRLVFPQSLFRRSLDPHKYSRSTEIRPELSRSEHLVVGLCTDVKAGSGWNPSCNRNRVLTLDMSYAGRGWGLLSAQGGGKDVGGRGRNFLRPTKVYGTRH